MTTLLGILGLSWLFRRKPPVASADDRLQNGRISRLEGMVRQLAARVEVLETENRRFWHTAQRASDVLSPNR